MAKFKWSMFSIKTTTKWKTSWIWTSHSRKRCSSISVSSISKHHSFLNINKIEKIFDYSLQDEINRIKKEWNHQLTQISKEHANENIEYRALQDECDTLKAELKIKDNHINRYKKELEDALDRERALEEAKAQLDIDWQKKLGQNQRQEYHKSEDLIEKLSTAHEQVSHLSLLRN